MKIESIDLFYYALPQVRDIADGSQDSFIVRIRADNGLEGFGESDSSPLVALACFCCPLSHSNIHNISSVLLGESVDSPEDIRRLYHLAKKRALDIAHFPHAYAAADIALWDLLGKKEKAPVYQLLGYDRQYPKRAYASVLFEDTPEATATRAHQIREQGFTAAKFGWGPIGQKNEAFDIDLVRCAREGLGDDMALMVDAGVSWGDDWETALRRSEAFREFNPTWLEEPLSPEAVKAYGKLSQRSKIPIAAGEGCDTLRAAEDLLENGGVHFLQIEAGRIGGITPSFEALQMAKQHEAIYVNHTFKGHLSLSAALSVFAGEPSAIWLEYCDTGSPLITKMVDEPLGVDAEGMVRLHEQPGLGIDLCLDQIKEFSHQVTITIDGKPIVKTL